MDDGSKYFKFTGGNVQSWPEEQAPVTVSYYADLLNGKPGWISHSVWLELEQTKSLIAALQAAVNYIEGGK